jgi:hypothetical protein
MDSQNKLTGIWSVVSNAMKHHELTSSEVDYHLLGSSLCNNLPCKKLKLMAGFMKEIIKRVQQNLPVILSHPDFRRCYTKGINSIYMNMPVPCGISGGKAFDDFAIALVENTVNHLLGHGILLKTMKPNK